MDKSLLVTIIELIAQQTHLYYPITTAKFLITSASNVNENKHFKLI